MTEVEAQKFLLQGSAIDTTESAAAELAASGEVDASGKIVAPAAPDPDAAAMEWLIVPQMMAWTIKMVFPEVAANYTPEAEMDLARKIVPVADKYGWNGPGNAPELALAVGAIGFSMPAILAYKARKENALEGPQNQPQGGADSGG